MKKIIVIASLIIITLPLTAQKIHFGAKAGVNFANYSGGGLDGYDFKNVTNLHIGIVSEIKLLDHFSVQPELLYTSQGSKIENAGQEFKDELGYIAVPILAKFYLTDQLSLQTGPQFSVLVKDKDNFDLHDSKTFDFAVAAGLEYKIIDNVFAQARYNLGLTEVRRDADIKNSVIQLSAGFIF